MNITECIADLRRLEVWATKGPWKMYAAKLRKDFPTPIVEIQDSRSIAIITWAGFDGADQSKREKRANAVLIVAIRNSILPLLDLMEKQRSALQDALSFMESAEMRIEGEWGKCRTIGELERDGNLSPEIFKVRAALATGEEL